MMLTRLRKTLAFEKGDKCALSVVGMGDIS